jgi:hypothetical protein
MAGLVEELQREALDPNVPVSVLLRKVKLVAVKLQLTDAVDWADAELKGYEGEVPDYRIVYGQIKSFHPYHGWRTMRGDAEMIEKISQRHVGESISSLEALVSKVKDGSGTLYVSLPPAMINYINESNGVVYTDVGVHIGENAFVSIIDRVRNTVFDWALDLERAGITGEGISFTMAEMQKAGAASITIGTMHGNLHAGDFSGGTQKNLVASTDNSVNVSHSEDVFSEAGDAIRNGVTENAARDELLDLLEKMKASKDKPEFSSWYTKFIQVAGDHMKVIGPFVGPLTALLAS